MAKISYKGRDVDGIDVDFKVSREDWNHYQLADGTELRMRLIVSEVYMVSGEYDQEGNPVYVVKSTTMVVAKSPDHLKKLPNGGT